MARAKITKKMNENENEVNDLLKEIKTSNVESNSEIETDEFTPEVTDSCFKGVSETTSTLKTSKLSVETKPSEDKTIPTDENLSNKTSQKVEEKKEKSTSRTPNFDKLISLFNKTIKSKNKKSNQVSEEDYPLFALYHLLVDNRDISRLISKAIIVYLTNHQMIHGNSKFVLFLPKKFQVKTDGLIKEYFYHEPFFFTCAIAGLAAFTRLSQLYLFGYGEDQYNDSILSFISPSEAEEIANIITE